MKENKNKHFNLKQILKSLQRYTASEKTNTIITFATYGLGTFLGSVIAPRYVQELFDLIATSSIDLTTEVISLVVTYITVNAIAGLVLFRIGDYTIVKSQLNMMHNARVGTFKSLLRHSQRFFANEFSGKLVARTKRYANSIEQIYDSLIFNLWLVLVPTIGAIYFLWQESVIMALIVAAWIILFTGIVLLFLPRRRKLSIKAAAADSKTTGQLSDVIANVMNVKTFAAESREEKEFVAVSKNQRQAQAKNWYWSNFTHFTQELMLQLFINGMLIVSVILWSKGNITPGVIILGWTYSRTIANRAWSIGRTLTKLTTAFANMQEMVDILRLDPEVADPAKPARSNIRKGDICFTTVSFTYPEGRQVFKDFSLDIPAGQSVGLVGVSGSGKTTISNLLMRFSDPQGGTVTIDGQNIASITKHNLRKNISFVPQEPILFHRTLAQNIAYAKPSSTKAEIIKAAKAAQAHDFIETLPQKYNTMVGERGIKLSGGQRQRIAIARSMIEDAPILILDEATSSLDTLSETHIKKAFAAAMKGRTTLVIAHRLSTISSLDRIIVLDGGKIIQDGTHTELMKTPGMYAKLWNKQALL